MFLRLSLPLPDTKPRSLLTSLSSPRSGLLSLNLLSQRKKPENLLSSLNVQPSGETELKRSTTKDVRSQEGKTEADKKAQAMRELLVEKRELRSQRDTLAREKASLETKLQGQTDAIKKVEGREEEAKKEVSAKNRGDGHHDRKRPRYACQRQNQSRRADFVRLKPKPQKTLLTIKIYRLRGQRRLMISRTKSKSGRRRRGI